jgi:ABC-2 type transport system ATP-binding protein
MASVYAIRDLRKVYSRGDVIANDGISLTIGEGEIFGILGPNGAGKTTLVRQLVGLAKPTSGSIQLFGAEISRSAASIPRLVAYLSQSPVALFDLTVREALIYTARLRGMAAVAAENAADALIADFELAPAASTLLEHLSGGQVRLVGIGAALIGDLPVLILDEPTNDLDPVNRRRVWTRLLDLKRERGATIILVTHNVAEAERVLDRVAIIDRGKVIALGTPAELKRQVDERVRLELTFKPEAMERSAELRRLGEAKETGDRRWMVLVERERAGVAVAEALRSIDLASLDDFRIVTTSLEDVYLKLGGAEALGE